MKTFTANGGSTHPVSDDCDLSNRTVVSNLNATVLRLKERPDRDVHELYGETVPIDKLKFTDYWPDTCGCHVRYMWRLDHEGEKRVHHAHLAIVKCGIHSHQETNEEHFSAVIAHNRMKKAN